MEGMARRLRVQYPDAIYHVMARGNGRQDMGGFAVSAFVFGFLTSNLPKCHEDRESMVTEQDGHFMF